jgi:hypothetical protein
LMMPPLRHCRRRWYITILIIFTIHYAISAAIIFIFADSWYGFSPRHCLLLMSFRRYCHYW